MTTLDIENAFMFALTNDYQILQQARDAVWDCPNFSFNDKIEIDDLLQKGVDVILKVSLNHVRWWYLLKVQQLVNKHDQKWFDQHVEP